MVDWGLVTLAKFCLWLRYRIRLIGMDKIAAKGKQGILFLPNHPALIDPVVLMTMLRRPFGPHVVADQDEVDLFFIRRVVRRWGALEIPDVGRYGDVSRQRIAEAMEEGANLLNKGENLLIYPAGHLSRTREEDLGASSAIETILKNAPNCRIVLMRTRGLWGSRFGWGPGQRPHAGKALKYGLPRLFANGLFFMPRRKVTIEFVEAEDFPRDADRDTINRTLEEFYNQDPQPNTYVPYMFWKGTKPRVLPEPSEPSIEGDIDAVSPQRKQVVLEHLQQLTGQKEITPETRLAHDLGFDSLARVDLSVWLDQEFGFACPDPEALVTVKDVMLAACGEAISKGREDLKPVSRNWYRQEPADRRTELLDDKSFASAFLARARRHPDKVVIADQTAGAKTYRQMVLGIMALRKSIQELTGEHVGILLPASVTANVVYMATMFAGKTPVMVNWTVGARNILHSLDLVGVQKVLTSNLLLEKLKAQGVDLSCLQDRFVALEEVAAGLSAWTKLRSWLASRLSWKSLDKAGITDTAVVLFTSGSESLPKAVPLSHRNLIANLRDIREVFHATENDRLLGILPPFHSFGLTVGIGYPNCLGASVVYHPNPTEADMLGKIIDTYKVSLVIGTPTFLSGIMRASTPSQLEALRLAVTGAEKCSDRVYNQLRQRCRNAVILEGYGVTECSPVVSVNDEKAPKPGTIGKVLPSVEYTIVDVDTNTRVAQGQQGMLLVRGESIFDGYIKHDGASPFVEFEGKHWYRTGDLVSEDSDGVLTFRGRLKRFIKLGGEMISLPAIEAVLEDLYATGEEDKPILAVTACGEDPPEIILVTTFDVDRAEVNQQLRQAGLSPLYTIRRAVRMDEVPVLGTGKTDYRTLNALLSQEV